MEAVRNDASFGSEQSLPAFSLSDLWKNVKARWYWYVISFVIVFGIATLYLLSAQKTYTRSVQILLKSDSSQYMTTDLEGLGIKPVSSDILDEMFIITSPAVIEPVVERLGLNRSYTTRKGLRSVDLYGISPIGVELTDTVLSARSGFSMNVELKPDNKFTLTELRSGENEYDDEITASLGDTVSTSIGRIAVYPTKLYGPGWHDRSVRFAYSDPKVCAEGYRNAIKAKYIDNLGSVIELTVTLPSTRKADDVLTGVVASYNDRWMNDRNKIAIATSEFIDDRLSNIERDLAAVEGNITKYQSRHEIVDMDAMSNLYLQQSIETRKALDALVQDIATARYVKGELEQNDITKLLPATADLSGTRLPEMVRTYNEMVVERNLRLQSMDESSPLLAKKTVAINEMRDAILESLDQTLAILNSRLKALQLVDSGNRHKLSDAPNQSRYLMSEDRKQKVMESLYVYLLQRREENQLSQAFSAYNTRMITDPFGDPQPTSPNSQKILAIALLIALALPTALIYILEITNNKVRSRADLSNLGVPYVGEIPSFKKTHPADKGSDHTVARQIMVRPKAGDVINEAFRMVRTNIEFMRRTDDKAKSEVIMVVSLVPGSGKTFISLNLAATFALKGKKVCLLDMDLRKGTLSRTVDSPRAGLTDVIVGDARLEDVIVHNVADIEGFDVLPEGTIPPNPTELLFSPNLKALIDRLRGMYDYVLMDCPPAEAVADAKVINKYTDMTVFVVRAGLLERSNLALIQEYYDSKRFNNMALVLNATEELHGAYGRYGYGNGYGQYTSKKNK